MLAGMCVRCVPLFACACVRACVRLCPRGSEKKKKNRKEAFRNRPTTGTPNQNLRCPQKNGMPPHPTKQTDALADDDDAMDGLHLEPPLQSRRRTPDQRPAFQMEIKPSNPKTLVYQDEVKRSRRHSSRGGNRLRYFPSISSQEISTRSAAAASAGRPTSQATGH